MKNKIVIMVSMALLMVSTVSAAQDVDGDGLYEDVNGDGAFNIQDVVKLFEMIENDSTESLAYDFNGNGDIEMSDVQALYDEGGFDQGDLSASQDIDSDGLNEDIDGDRSLTSKDVEIFYDNYDNTSEGKYDFNEDGNITVNDVQALYVEVSEKTSPNVGNESPEDGSDVNIQYYELDDRRVNLAVDAVDPAEEDVNVTFYDASDDTEISENTSGGSEFTASWDVDEYGQHEWYAVAESGDSNSTRSNTYSFEVTDGDTTAPSISFDSTPSDTLFDRDIEVSGTTDEAARVEYKIDDGAYRNADQWGWNNNFNLDIDDLPNGEHTITVRAEDKSGNPNTESFSVDIADGSDVSFSVNVPRAYPGSGIPIDPGSEHEEEYQDRYDVDFDFSLEGNGNDYDISNDYDDGICDFNGDEGWTLDGRNYCGTETPNSIETGVTYDLVAEWTLRGEDHRRVLDSNFAVDEIAQWYSTPMSHGGRVEGSVDASTDISGDSASYNDETYTCKGSTYEVSSINTVTARCSNGADVQDQVPPVVAFINHEGSIEDTANNEMFGDGNCEITQGVSRLQIQGAAGGKEGQGYRPENCNLGWQLGGDKSFDAHTFGKSGEYTIFLDYANAISNSPDYICPSDDDNELCASGSIEGDQGGWDNIKTETINVVDPEGNIIGTGFNNNVVDYTDNNGNTFIRRKDYSGEIQGTIEFKNTGTGVIEIDELDYNCPSGVDCTVEDNLPIEVKPGDTKKITWIATPQERTTGEISVTLSYDDLYGLECSSQNTSGSTTWEYTLDEKDPETDEEVNN